MGIISYFPGLLGSMETRDAMCQPQVLLHGEHPIVFIFLNVEESLCDFCKPCAQHLRSENYVADSEALRQKSLEVVEHLILAPKKV